MEHWKLPQCIIWNSKAHSANDESVTICPQNLSQAQNPKTPKPQTQINNLKLQKRLTSFFCQHILEVSFINLGHQKVCDRVTKIWSHRQVN